MPDVVFPYETLTAQPLVTLSSPAVDGRPAQLLTRERSVDLFELDGWREATVNVRVQVPREELERLGAEDYSVVVTVQCGPTNVRYARRLERSADGEQWTGELELPRPLLAGRADLYATVAGTVGGVQNRFLGRSPTFHVNLITPTMPDIIGGQIPVVWRDFSQAKEGQNPIDPALQEEISYVDLAGVEGPVVYLNERVTSLRRLLEERPGRNSIERTVREVVLDAIAQNGIAAMFAAAVTTARVLAEEGEPRMPADEWQRGVLEAMLPLIYPDREAEAALATAIQAIDSPEDAQDLYGRLHSAVARHVKGSRHVTQMIRALEALAGEENG